jgi:endonuclease YncB( thermonuclease family)
MTNVQQLLAVILLITSHQVTAGEKACHVTKVIDGDTIWVLCGTVKEKVRLTIIDSFEKSKNNRAFKQAYQQKLPIEEVVRRGKLASTYTTKELLNKDVVVKFNDKSSKDQYGRTLGEIYIGSVDINIKLLSDHPDVFLKY